MKKTLSFILAAAGFFGIPSAYAQDATDTPEPGDNETYTVSLGENTIVKDKFYSYQNEKAGYLTVTTGSGLTFGSDYSLLYTESLSKIPSIYHVLQGSGFSLLFKVEADMKYTIFGSFLTGFDSATITLSFEETITPALATVEPNPGIIFDDYSWASGIIMSFYPSVISYDSATYTYTPAGETEPVTESLKLSLTGQNTYQAKIWDLYMAAELDTDTYITINNANYSGIPVTGNYLQGNQAVAISDDGTITIHYPTPKVKLEILEESIPETVYSYFSPSNPEGKLQLTFSEDIESVDYALLIFGEHTYGAEGGSEEPDPQTYVNCSIDGATLTVDLAGINYENLGDISLYSQVTIMVFGITGVDGQSYPKGAAPYEVVLPFVNENYPGDVPPTYMTSTAKILSPALGEFLPELTQFVISWGEPVTLMNEEATVEVQIATEVPYFVSATINADGDLVLDVSEYSMVDGEIVVGLYTIVLPEGLVENAEGDVNVARKLTYTVRSQQVSAIETLIQEGAALDIYTLNGVKVNNAQIKSLKPGIYIVNGKKVILK